MTWWGYDIETEHWDRLVTACAVADDGRVCIIDDGRGSIPRNDLVANWYLNLPKGDIVWAHNGGGFDFLHLIGCLPEHKWIAKMGGSGIIACYIKGHAECRDTARLFPGSLADWTGRKSETGLACECGKECGGYCAIRRDLPDPQRESLLAYNIQDCRALLTTLREDVTRLRDEGLSILSPRDGLPRMTFGAVAWNTASATFHDAKTALSWGEYDAGRRAYYGGRCEVGRVNAALGHRYDVHAMYPWALTHPVPHGARSGLMGNAATLAYLHGRPGCYKAHVSIPATDIPQLPMRYNERRSQGRLHKGRLLWVTGEIKGWYTQIELAAAEQYGAKIRSIECAYVWQEFTARYAPYVTSIYDARDRARKDGDDRWASMLKWYANALSGKLAQRPDVESLVVTRDPQDGWDQLGGPGGRVWTKTHRRISPCARPIEAAYLTSRARIKLLDRLYRHSGRWLYCDTDSTYLLDIDSQDVHDSELGTFGYEGQSSEWLALAPKLYRYRCAPGECGKHPQGGGPHVRARGIPRPTWETLDDLQRIVVDPDTGKRHGATVRREIGVERLRATSAAPEVFVRKVVEKSHRDVLPDPEGRMRCGTRVIEADGSTRPLHHRRGAYL